MRALGLLCAWPLVAACGRLGFSAVDVEVDAPALGADAADAVPRTTRCDEQPMVFCDGRRGEARSARGRRSS